jgi:hypothetical protein
VLELRPSQSLPHQHILKKRRAEVPEMVLQSYLSDPHHIS